MKGATSPFTDPDLVNGALYATADRLDRRTGVLHRNRVAGRHAGLVVAEMAAAVLTPGLPAVVADVGCGRGTTARLLATRLPAGAIVTTDLSAARC